jgi:small subunit ribosomal protein S1
MESGELQEGEVIGHNRGGLLISFGGLQAFLPQSQIGAFPRGLSREERMERLPSLVGEKLPFKVIEVERRRRRLVVSNRDAVRAWERMQRQRLLEELTEGDVVRGTVSSLRDFGAFVDLGGADGLIHISELAWHRVKHASEVLSKGQEIEVYVLRLDYERQRIGLSLRRLQPDPWSLAEDTITPGDVVGGEVTNVVDFGAFVRVAEGIEGLVHVSEIPGGLSAEDALTRGAKVQVRVLRIDAGRERLGLSLRDMPNEGQVGSTVRDESQSEAPQLGEPKEDSPERGPEEMSALDGWSSVGSGDEIKGEGDEPSPAVARTATDHMWEGLLSDVVSSGTADR